MSRGSPSGSGPPLRRTAAIAIADGRGPGAWCRRLGIGAHDHALVVEQKARSPYSKVDGLPGGRPPRAGALHLRKSLQRAVGQQSRVAFGIARVVSVVVHAVRVVGEGSEAEPPTTGRERPAQIQPRDRHQDPHRDDGLANGGEPAARDEDQRDGGTTATASISTRNPSAMRASTPIQLLAGAGASGTREAAIKPATSGNCSGV